MKIDALELLFFSLILITILCGLAFYAFVSYHKEVKGKALSPYTGKPMWPGECVPYRTVKKVMHFLYYDHHSYDNRVFPMRRSVVCRETGRIFQNCYNWWGRPVVTWNFLQERCKGTWVSWGSLSYELQEEIRTAHGGNLEGFQTKNSSKEPSPRAVEESFIRMKPGPLCVDLRTKVLMGWKCVPGTDLEVLIIQRPKKT